MRVAIAEDSVLFREGVARVLVEAGLEVAAMTGNAEDLLAAIKNDPPDLAIIDVRMPPTFTNEGLRAAATIRKTHPQVAVIVLSQYVESEHLADLLGNGVKVGYLLKDRVTDLEGFIEVVQRVAAGGTAIDPEVISRLLGRKRAEDPLQALTKREREVLALMAEGLSNRGIQEHLFLSEKTIETHVRNIFMKLDIRENAEGHRRMLAVLKYLRAR
jgi:DNA-binding NarL/FixJ family response regulator